ncbi:uncharacterized protein EMH_0083680 [Eimeria mitis]|uniref:Dense granule protein GRA12 n=1 Tax=Eimeria mitis TaxID=44415 RepID=U6JP10_9EIME|nr:uncharacterized protein EMH_0083680 [Eimeria mitis]CDJ27245.1 hypothetical protein, conserved [Eimeria mitis]
MSPDVIKVDRRDVLGPGMWSMGPDGCRLGVPGNLIVTPKPGSTQEGGEILDPFEVGPEVCSWLSMMNEAHNQVRAAWEAEHARRRNSISSWNLLKRYTMWRKTFPQLEIDVDVRYMSLWNTDRFGHPLPWARVVFRYWCPDSEDNYGLFDHLRGSVFSQGKDPRVPTEVYLLLNPRMGFNRPLDVSASKWQFVTGAISGLSEGGDAVQPRMSGTVALVESMFVKYQSFTTLKGSINDCWMQQGHCYFKWLLRMEWRIFGETFCERVHRQANTDVGSAFKSSALNSVQVHVFGLDLFSGTRPVLYGMADEGVLGVNDNSGVLTMEIDTDPRNIPDFNRSKATARNIRAANMLFKGVSSFLGKRKGKEGKVDDDDDD